MSKTVAQGEFAHFGVLCQELQGERWPACTRGVGAQPILPARCWLVWEEPCPCGMRCWLPSRLNGQTLPGSGTRSALHFQVIVKRTMEGSECFSDITKGELGGGLPEWQHGHR